MFHSQFLCYEKRTYKGKHLNSRFHDGLIYFQFDTIGTKLGTFGT